MAEYNQSLPHITKELPFRGDGKHGNHWGVSLVDAQWEPELYLAFMLSLKRLIGMEND